MWVFEDLLSSWFTALAKTQYMGVLLISLSDFFVKFLQSHQGEMGSENVAKNPIPWFRTSNVPYWWLCYWRFHPPCLDKPINRTLIYVYTYSIIYIYIPYIPPYPTITFWLSPCSMANPMFGQSRRAGSGLSRHACTDLQPRSPQRLGWSNLIHKSIRYIPSCGQTLTYHISYIILSWKPSCCKKKSSFFCNMLVFVFCCKQLT